MSFRSLYRHGFARVAACTTRTSIADPEANARTILRMASARANPMHVRTTIPPIRSRSAPG